MCVDRYSVMHRKSSSCIFSRCFTMSRQICGIVSQLDNSGDDKKAGYAPLHVV